MTPLRVALLALALAPGADCAKKKKTYHSVNHPHDGHTQGADEFYPGHRHNEHHPLLAPKHSHHKLLTYSMSCDVAMVKKLLKEVPVDFPHDDQGDTALMYASMSHSYANGTSIECVKLLLDAGASVEKTDYEGRTSLMLAAQNNAPEILRELLDHGAHVDRKVRTGPDRGKTAIDIAERHKCDECVRMLKGALLMQEAHHNENERNHRSPGLEKRRKAAEASLRGAMRTYDHTWHAWLNPYAWYAWWQSYPDGDECWLHRALDQARSTSGADPALIAAGQALRGPIEEDVMDMVERKHICEEIVPYLFGHKLHRLKDLGNLKLSTLAAKTDLEPFEAHMLEQAVAKDIERHRREERAVAHFKKLAEEEEAKKRKEEMRRLGEEAVQPCGGS